MMMNALTDIVKLPSTTVVTEKTTACPVCQCVRFEERDRNVLDVLLQREARYQCAKCSRVTLLVKSKTEQRKTYELQNSNTPLNTNSLNNDVIAQRKYQLACKFVSESNDGVNPHAAFLLYLDAAKLGHCASQYCVGVMYVKGLATEKNLPSGLYWLASAAEQGHSKAAMAALKVARLLSNTGNTQA